MAPPRAQRLPCAKEAVSAPQSVGEIIDLPSPAHIPCPNGNPNPFSVSHFPLKQKRSHPDTLTHRIVPEPKLSHYHHTTESDLFPLRFLSAPSQKRNRFSPYPKGWVETAKPQSAKCAYLLFSVHTLCNRSSVFCFRFSVLYTLYSVLYSLCFFRFFLKPGAF